ncbi:hypothetical protein CDN99_26525 [Roseateles aquatilis]|uniref:DUF2946 domain-containing protein n=1 Tax=Roseateles aquatilis TaxID=431061 RepID=A0A246IT60_9BURK|nr:hypothetical protein [Roseateles aquatilis]OWQ83404.1 hypothetical protein CDN99_26525 [Roseateles aquatilis]
MTRWLRILVLTLLLPGYGIAAAGVTMFAAGVAHVQHLLVDGQPADPGQAATGDGATGDDADVAALLFELGDTSDDMPDHCKPDAAPVRPSHARMPPLCAPQPHAPDIWPQPLRRPPRA